jgi:hypothetical protein
VTHVYECQATRIGDRAWYNENRRDASHHTNRQSMIDYGMSRSKFTFIRRLLQLWHPVRDLVWLCRCGCCWEAPLLVSEDECSVCPPVLEEVLECRKEEHGIYCWWIKIWRRVGRIDLQRSELSDVEGWVCGLANVEISLSSRGSIHRFEAWDISSIIPIKSGQEPNKLYLGKLWAGRFSTIIVI